MTMPAILMMLFSILVLWGGLLCAILFLRAKPQVTEGEWAQDPDSLEEPPGH
ncbi:hypothetical protein BJY21_003187 [Kineosphaera limosa]|uniref:Methionine/alanine importer small subunit n=1 Tax=Kineosphaera limosa NBRC 100340 TaxID=1184609 RepID=K6XE46_9MICO|nr:methionine/alanine import family NSS transporter small subunit [Kineosphaera limosa]NYE02003.1 hypothetical protein [Kineosphaera limosa]GAB97109.1 hypothetical protein KILIM_056_00330 [Kineosphaera limosa NBRC 100340]